MVKKKDVNEKMASVETLTEEQKKKKQEEEDDLDEGGPWGLVIIFAAFMIQVFTFGTATSIGIYNVEFLEYFDNDISGVAVLTSLNIAFFLGGGPIANLLTKRFSHRSVVMFGTALVVISVFSLPWLDNLHGMIVMYGCFAGLGFCFCYVPSHVLSGLYFNKYRSLATGLATSGSGLGTAIFPPLASYLIDVYTWKGSLIILAGLNLHVFVFAMLLRPPPAPPKESEEDADLEPGDLPPELETPMTKKQLLKKQFCIFCDFGFDVYFVSNILWNCGPAVFIAFGPDFFKLQGMDKMDASFMLTIFGVGEFFGGIIGGVLGNIEKFNRLYIYIGVNLVGGVMVFLFPVIEGTTNYGVLCFFFGLCFGVILGLLIIVMTDLVGADRIGDGLGYLMIANGIGAFSGPPVAGLFKEMFGSYNEALYFSGITLLCSGFITILIPLQRRFCGEDVPEGTEKTTSAGRCARYDMMNRMDSRTSTEGKAQVEMTEIQRKEMIQGDYKAVQNSTNSPEHRVPEKESSSASPEHKAPEKESSSARTPSPIAHRDETIAVEAHENDIRVVLSEEDVGIDNKAVKLD